MTVIEQHAPFQAALAADSVPAPLVEMTNPDQAFWTAHAAYKAMLAEFEADPDDSNENNDRWCNVIGEAEADLMCIRVHTGAAVLAKLKIAREHDIDFDLHGKTFSALDVIEWDMERLTKKQWWPG